MQPETTNLTSIHHHDDATGKPDKDGLPMQLIKQWKTLLFNAIADRLCDQRLLTVQRAIGAWKTDIEVRLPYRNEVTVLGDGPLSVNVHVGEERNEVSMLISVHLSDVRVSAMVPREVLGKGNGLTNSIAECLGGQRCEIIKNERNGNIFEWSFRENGVADKSLMLSSIKDPVYASLLADSISNILSNIYISIMTVLSHEGVELSSEEVIANQKIKQLVADITRLPATHHIQLISSIRDHGITVEGFYPQLPDRLLVLLSFDIHHEAAMTGSLWELINALDAALVIHEVRK